MAIKIVHSFEAVKERVVELRSRRAILFVGPAHDDPERIIRQWPLQRLRLIPRRTHPHVPALRRWSTSRPRREGIDRGSSPEALVLIGISRNAQIDLCRSRKLSSLLETPLFAMNFACGVYQQVDQRGMETITGGKHRFGTMRSTSRPEMLLARSKTPGGNVSSLTTLSRRW